MVFHSWHEILLISLCNEVCNFYLPFKDNFQLIEQLEMLLTLKILKRPKRYHEKPN